MKGKVNFLDSKECRAFIEQAFSDNPSRLAHIITVSDRVRETAERLKELHPSLDLDSEMACCAALVHDIGYIGEAAISGFHPRDGYNFLVNMGFPELASLIVGHGNSPEQSRLRGLPEIRPSEDLIAKLITYWDVQVLQGGQIVSYKERLLDIKARYGEKSEVYLAHKLSESRIRKIIEEIDRLLHD